MRTSTLSASGHVAAHQRQVVFGIEIAGIGDGAELAEFGLDGAFRHAPEKRSCFMR